MTLYSSTQKLLKFGFWFFYRKVHIIQSPLIPETGPVLIVANHPNSFMDALLIGTYLKKPMHFLARGDAFKNPLLARIFKAYKMLPVYRISEGKENIERNFETFDVTYHTVNNGGTMLIFGEGLCVNNWDLRPLKKGPARIASRAWTSNDPAKDLVIVPVGLTYEHFEGGGKSVVINYGTPITREQFSESLNAPSFTQELNRVLVSSLQQLAYVNPALEPGTAGHDEMMRSWQQAEKRGLDIIDNLPQAHDRQKVKPVNKRWFTMIHAGIFGLPHYWLCMAIAGKLTKNSVFYDSVLFGLVLFLFPLYWITIIFLVFYFI